MRNVLPLNNLGNKVIRNSLIEHVINPMVFRTSRSLATFRVVWRVGAPPQDDPWDHIHSNRERCDAAVKTAAGVEFFFSSVTGLYNKNVTRSSWSRTHGATIHPGISYYVVCDGSTPEQELALRWQIQQQFADAEVKPISTLYNTMLNDASLDIDANRIAAPLFVALKDYNSSFVCRKVDQSARLARHSGVDEPLPDALELQPTPVIVAKLVVANPSLGDMLSHAYNALVTDVPSFYLQLEL